MAEEKLDNSNADGHNDSDSDDSQVSHASAGNSRGNRSKSGPSYHILTRVKIISNPICVVLKGMLLYEVGQKTTGQSISVLC